MYDNVFITQVYINNFEIGEPMKVVIFGTGGVGGYFGGRLAQAGRDVTFIARGKHLEAIREAGLKISSTQGDFLIHPAKATDSTESIGVIGLVILATKGWHLDSSIEKLRPLIGENTAILPLLNGMEHMDKLINHFGEEHILGGVCRISAFIEAPGHIRQMGVQPTIAYGELDNSKTTRIESVHKTFSNISYISAEIPIDINIVMWEKYVFISGISGVGAIARKPINEYRSDPQLRTMLINAMKETFSIAKARGVNLLENFVDETMKRIDNLPMGMLASMQKDIMEGSPSELDDQIGGVIRMGKALNIPTPTHEKIYAELLPFEQKARGIV
jgi:2-dehydropantoate 2-reductase